MDTLYDIEEGMCALNASDFTSEADASCIYVILPLMVACTNPDNNFRYGRCR